MHKHNRVDSVSEYNNETIREIAIAFYPKVTLARARRVNGSA